MVNKIRKIYVPAWHHNCQQQWQFPCSVLDCSCHQLTSATVLCLLFSNPLLFYSNPSQKDRVWKSGHNIMATIVTNTSMLYMMINVSVKLRFFLPFRSKEFQIKIDWNRLKQIGLDHSIVPLQICSSGEILQTSWIGKIKSKTFHFFSSSLNQIKSYTDSICCLLRTKNNSSY